MKKVLIITICGAPNAGKSTLLNKLVGEKVSIVSPKVQTTRNSIRGIVCMGDTQMIFTDTPGIFRARSDFSLEKRISGYAWKVVRASNTVILLIDGQGGLKREIFDILADFKTRGRKVITVINKIDLLGEKEKLDLGLKLEEQGDVVEAIFYISSTEGTGVEKLTNYLQEKAEEGDWIYDNQTVSDISLNMTASEVVREKIFLVLKEEIPYHTAVVTEKFDETAQKVEANILITVTKESQKVIMIGKRGENLKKIKHAAEAELTQIFGKPTLLSLFIRVRADWREREDYYSYMKI